MLPVALSGLQRMKKTFAQVYVQRVRIKQVLSLIAI
jgi:hypothetical protein